ncbi:GTP 3',8-cyclase MoaA [Aquisalimonas lutea]|uniref:GTP 3',8-cyclase MoaA n=1 Tax=Aquisalimonas lutea TaxID=1327750 RepID=UPI0025B5495C|nr:GTP 3',8-cyclase MoaA [Aquisalimonas lutea]MDN3516457.1 GTP 3',8-cyclase MoaA [Aquisalimonas lutea]
MATEDVFHRPLQDLRISVTDRCNFRCVYCMPKEIFGSDYPFLARRELLTFEEITRLTRIFAGLGVRKLRITGGEPLVRKDLPELIEMLASIDGIDDITLTTNASLLPQHARDLVNAGLNRVTVSLDAIDDDVFKAVNDVNYPVGPVLEGIEAASRAGLDPVKVNMVVKRGMNEGQIVPMAEYFRNTPHILRYIEFMDVGNSNGWRLDDVVTAAQIRDELNAVWPIEPLDPNYTGEVASRYRYVDGAGEIGIISSVSEPFCSTCTRARLASQGQLFTCLFAGHGHDLRTPLRDETVDDEQLADIIRGIWRQREDRYSEQRTNETAPLQWKVEMSHVGG